MKSVLSALLLLNLAIAPTASAEHPQPTRRFSLIVGANDGGAGRVRLRYAGSDADAVARLFVELGGISRGDQVVLLDPDRAALQRGLEEVRKRLARAPAEGSRPELFFYYSGHSDEEGLLLGGERFGYAELRHALDEMPADVRVAILDSCASGALTRRKGGVARPSFLVDASTAVKGHAFLTASSADEAAQESDRLGASFFTHHLVSGLRGAADSTGSGKVTLTEAYRYAFRETLAQTERTTGGAQHPGYEMQLVGSGDLVMTDLRATSAGLVVGDDVEGRIYVRDVAGSLVVEVRKLPAAPLELGLAPGDYTLTLEERGSLYESRIVLTEGRRTRLDRAQLREVQGEATVRRGGDDAPGVDGSAKDYEVIPFSAAVFPEIGSSRRTINHFGLHLIGGRATRLDGTQISLGFNMVDELADGAQVTSGANFAGGGLSGTQVAVGANFSGGRVGGSQVSIGANVADGELSGAQVSVGANHAGGRMEGAQVSVGANFAGGDASGSQISVGTNFAGGNLDGAQIGVGVNGTPGRVDGYQASVGGNYAGGDVVGAQLGVGANFARGDFNGLQAAVGANVVTGSFVGAQLGVGASVIGGDFRGLQTSVGASVVGERMSGLQTGVLGYARSLDGLQLSLVNVAGEVSGSQIGLVNISGGSTDFQLGLVNYADDSDAAIGVVNVSRKGRKDLELFATDVNYVNLAAKLGSRYTYGILTAGVSPGREEPGTRWSFGAGVGTRLDLGWTVDFLDLDLTAHNVHRGWNFDSSTLLNVLRMGAGFRFAERFAVVLGPTLNLNLDFYATDRSKIGLVPGLHHAGKNVDLRFWPGVFAGVQI
ncbi:caspase family protein [Vulgatibacter incomptus]|uniref:Peptidase C14 caspase catalytic subunit p20 n=1 Tax=Vulgatibacter incomptus TaxID=1391653 RepID=A0A0K1PFM9_9BACT|nr:caspase family protein [Vulgatibacter incomptus]AKU92312.1 peptidase C14 caspase catalytic subunit p20 [Vulgatibacter incomptus]